MTAETMTHAELRDAAAAKKDELKEAEGQLAAERGALADAEEAMTAAARAGSPTRDARSEVTSREHAVEDLTQRVDALRQELAPMSAAINEEERRRRARRCVASGADPTLTFLRLRTEELRLEGELAAARRLVNTASRSVSEATGRDGMSWMEWADAEVRAGRLSLPGITSMCDTYTEARAELARREAEVQAAADELALLGDDA